MKTIELTQGKVTMVDDEDFDSLNQYNWYCSNSNMAMREKMNKGVKTRFIMHRVIMNAPEGMEVDHINGNRLDNRKENLRICTRQQNLLNKSVRSDSKSGYKGVEFKTDQQRKKPYNAYIVIEHKKTSLGHFETDIEAAKAYDEAARKYHGEFAKTNF